MLVWDPSSGSDTKVYTGSTIGAAQLVRTDGNWDAFVGKEGNWVVDGVVMG
jgi:hydroxylamine reductase (hybrid-cluster protein)